MKAATLETGHKYLIWFAILKVFRKDLQDSERMKRAAYLASGGQ